jgi:hypothetical protein
MRTDSLALDDRVLAGLGEPAQERAYLREAR